MAKTFLIYGVSKGLGKALIEGVPDQTDTVYGVSRTEPPFGGAQFHWIPADLSDIQSASIIKKQLGEKPIDTLIYNVGIWEKLAFTEEYDFESTSDVELLTMIQTNISACLLNLKALLSNLRLGNNSKIILLALRGGWIIIMAKKSPLARPSMPYAGLCNH